MVERDVDLLIVGAAELATAEGSRPRGGSDLGALSVTASAALAADGGRIVAVGSTSVRTLESLDSIEQAEGATNIFIYPPYEFQKVDAILTNFHLPKSTLLMMMSAFAGREQMLHAYEVAVQEKYRFFSYGDCMLIL